MHRAGFFPRAAALFIDLLVFCVAAHAVVLADVLANDRLRTNDFGTISGIGVAVVVIAIMCLEMLPGGDGMPGKRMMRLEVRAAAADGSPAPTPMRVRRALAKFAAFFLVPFPVFLFTITGPNAGGWGMPSYMHDGLGVVAIVDTVIAGGAVLVTVGGCFRALRADGLALHDLAAGTAVFHRSAIGGGRGFLPVLPAVDAEIKTAPSQADDDAPAGARV
jgi:uncharacterized RDD family membrane protein YckC